MNNEVLATELSVELFNMETELKDKKRTKAISKSIREFIKSDHVKKLLKNKCYNGCFYEDYLKDDYKITEENVSHRIRKIYIKNKKVYVDIEILDTDKGHRLLKDLCRTKYYVILSGDIQDKINNIEIFVIDKEEK